MSVSMEDRELLELAAEAAGYQPWGSDCEGYPIFVVDSMPIGWNPLTDDADALRLLCKLKLSLNSNSATVGVGGYPPGLDHVFSQEQISDGDALSAHRRAIVRAAAEIGKAIQEKH